MMRCRLCHSSSMGPVPFELPEGYTKWYRCGSCGSDSSESIYQPEIYTEGQSEWMIQGTGGIEACRQQVQSNCDWFAHYHTLSDRSFLDVGCGDGAALDVMQSLGWTVHGWDVVRPHFNGPHITVSPVFSRWLFPQRYATILSRESLEHSPVPDMLLHELHGVILPGGLVQVQTPLVADEFHDYIYTRDSHLFIPSEKQLRKMLNHAMFDIIEHRIWGGDGRRPGQAYLCRARS